jgi:hypothetical protein
LWFRKSFCIERLVVRDLVSLLHLAGSEEDTNGRGVPVLIFS